MISWIVFDAMGVIYTESDDVCGLLLPFVLRYNPKILRKTFIDTYVQASIGRITSRELWEQFGLGNRYPDIERLYLDTMLTIDKDFRSVALGLREKFLLGLLSNDVAEWSVHLRNRFDLNFFEATVVSGEAMCRKPHPEIFELFLKRSKANAPECVFVDDRKKNLEAAASLGFKTVWFHRIEDDHAFMADVEITSLAGLENAIARIT